MSFQEFIHMGGYGFYIWMSYGLAAFVFGGLFVSLKMQRNKLIKQLHRRHRQERYKNEH